MESKQPLDYARPALRQSSDTLPILAMVLATTSSPLGVVLAIFTPFSRYPTATYAACALAPIGLGIWLLMKRYADVRPKGELFAALCAIAITISWQVCFWCIRQIILGDVF